ncbi:hypothetical protein PG996_002087 [Apiospora saccharicola]|uniref:CENP-V/GFA domain-containing protein n=1 Tax=Apiospora saccharicola TaxID=335842 RepID=A0ABR1WIG5_9PEZI
MADSTVEITAQCLCKRHTFKASIARSSLPIKASTCHCHSCRHMTGAMYSSEAPWPAADGGEAVANSTLQRYVFSERLTVRFCGTCSSPMFWEFVGQSKISVFTGVLTGHADPDDVKDLVQITDVIFVGDTLDGGAAPWLKRPNGTDGEKARLWAGPANESEELPHDWLPPASLPDASKKSALEQVAIRCRCKGVDLVMQRWSPELEAEGGSDSGARSWIIDPDTHKGLGSFDACDSCRLASGVDVFNWTFVLWRQVGFAGETKTTTGTTGGHFPVTSTELNVALSAQERDSRFGTLTCYSSSPGTYRYSCSRCSACVFYGSDRKLQFADVALGVLDAPDGARAEDFVSWNFGGDMVWRNDIVGTSREGFVESIESEAEAWRFERGYPKNFYRIKKEEAKPTGS